MLAGAEAASPAATPMRASASCAKDPARAQTAVDALHRQMATEMMFRRLLRSAKWAVGRAVME